MSETYDTRKTRITSNLCNCKAWRKENYRSCARLQREAVHSAQRLRDNGRNCQHTTTTTTTTASDALSKARPDAKSAMTGYASLHTRIWASWSHRTKRTVWIQHA